MEAGFRLQDTRIAIVGLGLMGGSLALALRDKCALLYGIDSDPAALELALEKKIVNQAAADPARLLPRADLVVLAAPVPAILELIPRLPGLTKNPCILLDLGSTKRQIVQAMSLLPAGFDPLGGHPICGKERLGLKNSDANLFQNAPFVITPLQRTTKRARSCARQIVAELGAIWVEMSAGEHDRILASTSHLPFVIAASLAHCTPPEFASLIGSGFRSTGRLAGTPSSMMMGVLRSNRDNILSSIEKFRGSLSQFESALKDENDTELEQILTQSRNAYLALTGTS